MDKDKFWLGVRRFNTASPRLVAPTQRRAGPPVGHPNATQGTSASWVPQHNARHVCKLGAPTQRKARPQVGRPNATQGTSTSWVPERTSATQMEGMSARSQVGCPNAMQGTSASWVFERMSVMQTEGTSSRPQVGRPNGMQGTSASWAPKRNARRVRKMGTQTKNSSATKTSTQGSTRIKDELEDG